MGEARWALRPRRPASLNKPAGEGITVKAADSAFAGSPPERCSALVARSFLRRMTRVARTRLVARPVRQSACRDGVSERPVRASAAVDIVSAAEVPRSAHEAVATVRYRRRLADQVFVSPIRSTRDRDPSCSTGRSKHRKERRCALRLDQSDLLEAVAPVE